MRQKGIFSLFFLLMLLLPLQATAQSTVTVTPTEKRMMLKTSQAQMQAAIQERRATFAQKLAELKDARKKAIVERVDGKLAMINKNRTDHMTKVIQRLETLLTKFSERAKTLKGQGTDTTSVDSAISAAKTAIEQAKTAVAAQAALEYTPEIADETTLRQTVGAALKNLQNDLKTTYGVVKEAKRAVMKVAEELAKVRGSDLTPTPIQSGPTANPTGSQ